jgi:FkbM family methyltransferase
MNWLIGVLMRLYRRSPLYPAWGRRFAAILSRLPGTRRAVTHTVDGVTFELDLAEVIDSSLYYSGTFEANTERAITELLGLGMTAIDIGANIGYHTFRMARAVGPQGKVLAVEPMSRARVKLERNAALNPQFENIEISDAAVSDSTGHAHIGFQSSYRLDGRDEIVAEDVRVLTVDALVEEAGLPRVDFIKIDVDGFEGKVIRGAEQTLRAWHPTLVFEISPGAMAAVGDDPDELVDLLESIGYGISYEDGQPIEDRASLLGRVGDHSINLVARTGEAGDVRESGLQAPS